MKVRQARQPGALVRRVATVPGTAEGGGRSGSGAHRTMRPANCASLASLTARCEIMWSPERVTAAVAREREASTTPTATPAVSCEREITDEKLERSSEEIETADPWRKASHGRR